MSPPHPQLSLPTPHHFTPNGSRSPLAARSAATETGRSEERRGGKEGRSRWAPYHLKKKEFPRVAVQGCDFRSSKFSRCLIPFDELHFFSSRRRHTRYIGDWSSDVCSSDLKRSSGRGRNCGRAALCRRAESSPPWTVSTSAWPPKAHRTPESGVRITH